MSAPIRPTRTYERGSFALALRLLRSYLTGESLAVSGGLAALLATSLIALLEPWPLKLVVDSVLGSYPPPAILSAMARSISAFIGSDPASSRIGLLTLLCLGVIALKLVLGLLRLCADYLLIGIGLRMVFRLRCAVFDHVQRLSLVFHDNTTVGDSLYRVAWDTYSIQTVFNNGLIQMLSSSITVVGIACVMFSRDWLLSVLAVAFGVPMIFVLRRVDAPIQRRSLAVNEQESAVTSRVQQTLSAIRVVQAFSGEKRESWQFRDRAEQSARASLRLTVLQSASALAIGLVLAVGIASVIWLASYRVLTGRLTPGDVVLIASYVALLYKPLEAFAFIANTIQRASAGTKRVFDVLDTQPRIRNVTGAKPFPEKVQGHIVFEQVTFGYAPGRNILDGVSFDAAPGSRIALVGPSGVGKTTIASLLMRFYDPDEGRILIDGSDIRTIDVKSLRDNLSLVLQEPVLFATTLRENIAYGRPDATWDEIREAVKAAGAQEFIEALPAGYDTQVGERGVLLSGGQRQRIAIARAFLKNAPILLMDEPTSALDTDTEANLLVALEALMRGCTTITIAHRLSTIRAADRILVVQDGRIHESGSHDELVRTGGIYASLHRKQSGLPADTEVGVS